MQYKLTPLKITLIYVAVAAVWIALSDHALNFFLDNPDTLSELQTYKGLFYVALTSLGLYYLIKQHDKQLQQKERELENQIEEHRSQQEFLEKLIDHIPVMITMYNPHLDEFEVNKEFEQVTGWTNEEVHQIELMNACYPDPAIRESAIQFMGNPGRSWMELPLTTKTGETVQTRWSNIKLTDNTQVGIGIDISERKNYENELKLQKQKLEQAQEIAGIGYWVYDMKTGQSDWSDSLYNILGYKREKLPPSFENLMRILHPEDQGKFEDIEKIVWEEEQLEYTFRVISGNGDLQYCHTRAQLIRGSEGEPSKFMGTVLDITSLKVAEKELQKSQKLLQKTFESLNSAICIINTETRTIVECNPYTEKVFGYSREELIGETTKMLHVKDEKFREFNEIGAESLKESGAFNTEFEMQRKNGEKFPTDHTVTLLHDQEGKAELAVSVVRDITDRKKYENELRESRERLARAQRIGKLGDWEYDPESERLFWSPMVYEIFGLKPGEKIPTIEQQIDEFYKDQGDLLQKKVIKALQDGIPYDLDLRLHTKKGDIKYVRAICIPMVEDSGDVYKLIGTVQDITERKEAEQKLHESEKKYRLLFEDNPQPMWIYDPETLQFVEVNKAAISHYGYSRKEFMRMSLFDIRPTEYENMLKDNVQKNRENHVYGEEWVHHKKDGSKISVNISAAPLSLNGTQYRLVVIKDITEQKQAEKDVLTSLIEGEERERKRIAKELHDGLAQYLSASNMNFQSMKSALKNSPQKKKHNFNAG
ncbi:MAG: PAS domain S-box protein [Balneolaceae bacterium]|nr:PAS domain S-box protein [Balneolaceae bacterium]